MVGKYMFPFLSLILHTNLNSNVFRQFIKRLYLILAVRDIHEVYRMFGEMICGTHMVHMGSPEREEACSFCFLALRLVSRVEYSFI
jgi:hypothetical protein